MKEKNMSNNLKIKTLSFVFACIIYACFCCFVFLPTAFTSPKTCTTIVIDAGHGGIDNGVYGITTNTAEANLNLEIAFLLGNRLGELGVKVVYTRKDADGLYGNTEKGFKRRDMRERKRIAENANADFLISVHCNFSPYKSAKGVAVYYNKNNALSALFAENFCKVYGEKVRKSAEKMYITYDINVPSVILECGFLSNEEDEQKLLSTVYRKDLVNKIAAALLKTLYETI